MSENQLSSAARRELLAQELWALMERQVKDYHKHHKLGKSSSVSQETAQELMASIQFTLSLVPPQETMTATLALGQAVLEAKTEEVKRLWKLVGDTVPDIDDDHLPRAITSIGTFLNTYDFRFFAHRTPDMEYPLLRPIDGSVQGIFFAEQYLRHLWTENQILAPLDGSEISTLLEAQLPDHWAIPLNLCEQALINALGRVLLGLPVPPVSLSDEQVHQLSSLLRTHDPETLIPSAIPWLAQSLRLTDPSAAGYLDVLPRLILPRVNAALPRGGLSRIFIPTL